MKSFSKSTLVGLLFGIFLAGYAVFAYTPPTVAPTGGNALAPINVGVGAQTKSGGLWLNNGLVIDGGLRIGLFSTAARPACVQGTIIFDTTAGRPYVCDGTSWSEYRGPTGATGSTGSTGATGPEGPAGTTASISVYTNFCTWDHPGTTSCTATCNSGDIATGGGFSMFGGWSSGWLQASPSGDDSWYCFNGIGSSAQKRCYVRCLDIP